MLFSPPSQSRNLTHIEAVIIGYVSCIQLTVCCWHSYPSLQFGYIQAVLREIAYVLHSLLLIVFSTSTQIHLYEK